MRFALALDIGRETPDVPLPQVFDDVLELVRMADQGGFDTVFAGEHHAIELTIAPNPFVLLASWAKEVKRIRLGTAVVCAPYWHPLRLAGESAFVDLLSEGRLELGIGRGAYTFEADRMGNGVRPEVAREALMELVPALKALWAGDYEHHGKVWSFPTATSVPKPAQSPHPSIWISARHPDVFRFAVENECNVMATPLHWPFEEVISLRERLDAAVSAAGGTFQPKLMMLRKACVYDDSDAWRQPVDSVMNHARYFETLFSNVGGVHNGFVDQADLSALADKDHYTPEAVWENHVFGTPEQVIAKLKRYEAAGVDTFLYGGRFGLPHSAERRSLELFISEVMPAFAADEVSGGSV